MFVPNSRPKSLEVIPGGQLQSKKDMSEVIRERIGRHHYSEEKVSEMLLALSVQEVNTASVYIVY